MSRTVKIGSTFVLVAPDWSINDTINSRSVFSCTVVDKLGLTSINEGDSVTVTQDANVIFNGTIDTVDEYEEIPNYLFYTLECVDNNALADKRIIADSFVNTLAGDIVKSFITNKLTEEGITQGVIQNGALITKAVFNYDSATTALDYLKNITGFNWNIDKNKALHFFDRSTNAAPWALTDSVQHHGFKRNRTRQQYRNRQYIRAGKGETNTQTLEKPSPKPDGISRSFVMRFPLAKKPRIFINSFEVAAIDIGINGIDTGKKYYFTFDSNVITQDSSQVVLSATDLLEVTYIGLFPILTVADSPAEISSRKTKESGTSGIYENLTKESSINSSSSAIQYAQGLLVKYGIVPSTINFNTEVSGLQAGQILSINKPLYGINGSFLIDSITITGYQNSLNYEVRCLDGSSLGGWEQFFKDLIKGNREFVIQENEVLILTNFQTEQTGLQGKTSINIFASLFPSDTLYPSNTLYPNTLIQEVIVND